MVRKIEKGDRVTLTGEVTRVGEDGLISVRLHGLDYPVSLYEVDISEVIPGKKEPEPRNRRKPLIDTPD